MEAYIRKESGDIANRLVGNLADDIAGELYKAMKDTHAEALTAQAKSSETIASEGIIDAIDTLVSPDSAAWEVICREVGAAIPHNSIAGRSFYKLVEAVDNYRREYWPDNYPSTDAEPENRDDALADIRYEEARDLERDVA